MLLYLMCLKELLVLEHVAHSGGNWHFPPGLEGLLCVCDSGVELGLGALRHLSNQLLGGLTIKYETYLILQD